MQKSEKIRELAWKNRDAGFRGDKLRLLFSSSLITSLHPHTAAALNEWSRAQHFRVAPNGHQVCLCVIFAWKSWREVIVFAFAWWVVALDMSISDSFQYFSSHRCFCHLAIFNRVICLILPANKAILKPFQAVLFINYSIKYCKVAKASVSWMLLEEYHTCAIWSGHCIAFAACSKRFLHQIGVFSPLQRVWERCLSLLFGR